MQISTKVVLSQKDLDEAVIAFVTAKLNIPENTSVVTVDFVDDDNNENDLTAVVEIQTGDAGPKTENKPATTKGTRTPKQKAPEKESEPAVADAGTKEEAPWVEHENTQPANITASPEDRKEPEQKVEQKAEEKPVETKAPKIFPDVGSSAPAQPKEETPPAVSPKSLFANLTKPVHDAPRN